MTETQTDTGLKREYLDHQDNLIPGSIKSYLSRIGLT